MSYCIVAQIEALISIVRPIVLQIAKCSAQAPVLVTDVLSW